MDLVLHSPVADRESRNRRRNRTDES